LTPVRFASSPMRKVALMFDPIATIGFSVIA
jgi:hypothetical protein